MARSTAMRIGLFLVLLACLTEVIVASEDDADEFADVITDGEHRHEEGEDDEHADEYDHDDHEDDEGYDDEDEDHLADFNESALRTIHSLFDKNGDGIVTKEEVFEHKESLRPKEPPEEIFSHDENKDGKISLSEMMKDPFYGHEEEIPGTKARFSVADANKDGVLKGKELIDFLFPSENPEVLKVASEYAVKLADKDGDGHLNFKEWFELAEHQVEPTHYNLTFMSLDDDMDEKLSPQEFEIWESKHWHVNDAITDMFHMADMDGNGITVDEFLAARREFSGRSVETLLSTWHGKDFRHDEF